jgi:hypothetical protein
VSLAHLANLVDVYEMRDQIDLIDRVLVLESDLVCFATKERRISHSQQSTLGFRIDSANRIVSRDGAVLKLRLAISPADALLAGRLLRKSTQRLLSLGFGNEFLV